MLNRFVNLAIFSVIAWSRLSWAFAADPLVTSEQLPFLHDISIAVADVEAPADIILNKTVRIYATVHNDSDQDIKGVVRFYNERIKAFMGPDQPFSAVAHGTDVVFLDVIPDKLGETPVAVRVVPDNQIGDDPSNNKVTDILVVDHDSDNDGISNRRDPDDDNDGTPDKNDVFPLDPKESLDTDGDKIGNNTDLDDDNDQVPDAEDAVPTNHGPVLVINVGGGGGGGSSYRFTYDTSDTSIDTSSENASTDNNTVSNNISESSTSLPSTSPATSSSSSSSGSGPSESSGSSGSSQSSSITPSSQESSAPSTNSEPTPLKTPTPTGTGGRSSPTPSESPPSNPKVGEVMTFDASKSYDPDGKIVTVKWDFGDGVVEEGVTVDHQYQEPGDYLITLTLADDKGETRKQTWKIKIGQKITPWIIGILVALLLMGLRFFWKQQHSLKKSLSPKKKWSKITPL